MLRSRYRKANTATLPFRIRNNFRRLPNSFSESKVILSDNNDNERMLQEDFEEDNYKDSHEEDDDLEQRSEMSQDFDDNVDGGDHSYDDSDDDDLEQRNEMSQEDFDDDNTEGGDYSYDDSNDDDDLNNDEGGGDNNIIPIPTENEEHDANNSSGEKLFVDAALGEDKLPSFNGDFAPYFENFTIASLFCWIHKHNVSTNAYEDLVDIIMKPEFNRDHIVKNIRRFRTWRERLPLLSISANSVSISSKKTQSTSKDSKMAYQLSISDIIWYVLNNPSLFKDMYFGPGVDSETKSEYWHGTLWAESPLFGQEQLIISGGNYTCY